MFFLLSGSALALIIQILFLQSTFFGVIFFGVFITVCGVYCARVLAAAFPTIKEPVLWLLGMCVFFTSLSFVGGAFITFFSFSKWYMSFVVLLCVLIVVGIHYKLYKTHEVELSVSIREMKKRFIRWLQRFFLAQSQNVVPFYLLIGLLAFIAVYSVFGFAQPNEHIVSPWEALPEQFVWVIVILSCSILWCIFFRPRSSLLLFIIGFSLLVHAYVPGVYRYPFGLDDWRHIGMVEQVARSGNIDLDSAVQEVSLGQIPLPSVFFTAKPSYASFWAASLFLHKSLAISLMQLFVWWHFIFFSIYVPLILYCIGVLFRVRFDHRLHEVQPYEFQNPRFALLFAFVPLLFYPMQIYGSTSLPVGYNFITFLLFILFGLGWIFSRKKILRWFVFLWICAMVFGYILYFIVAVLSLGAVFILQKSRVFTSVFFTKATRVGYLLASVWVIPLVSLWVSPNARFDILKTGGDHISDLWQHIAKYLFGFKLPGAPRPQAGNLIWHDMSYLSVPAHPFDWKYFDTVLLICLVFFMFISLVVLLKKIQFRTPQSMFVQLMVYIGLVSLLSIYLDHAYFGGIHLLSERLDLLVDLFLSFLIAFGVLYLIKYQRSFKRFRFSTFGVFEFASRNWKQGCAVFFLSFVLGSTLISGPIYGRATGAHFTAVQWIYRDMLEQSRISYCVLSEHFPLAALEAVSSGRIQNGNFPIKYGYLEESGKIFIKMFSNPKEEWIQEAAFLAGSSGCYFLLDERFLVEWNHVALNTILGKEVYHVDDVFVWRYDNKKESSK